MKPWHFISIALACSTMSSCVWRKKPTVVQTPPPPVQRPAAAQPSAAKSNAPPVRKSAKKPVKHVVEKHIEKKAAPRTASTPSATQASTEPAANLGQMLSPAERAQLTESVNQRLSSARRNLALISGYAANPEQVERRKLVETFISQAEQARQTDLTTAAQLARRAELLAESLAGAIR